VLYADLKSAAPRQCSPIGQQFVTQLFKQPFFCRLELNSRVNDRLAGAGAEAEADRIGATDQRLRANVAWMLAGNLWQGLTQWLEALRSAWRSDCRC